MDDPKIGHEIAIHRDELREFDAGVGVPVREDLSEREVLGVDRDGCEDGHRTPVAFVVPESTAGTGR